MAEEMDLPFRIVVIRLEKCGKAFASNTAIDVALGKACLLIDDDVFASDTVLAAHLEAHEADPMTVGVGPLEQTSSPGQDWYQRAYAIGWNQRYEGLVVAGRGVGWWDCYGGNLSAPLTVLRRVGGFDPNLKAILDLDLGYRLAAAGCVPRLITMGRALHVDEKPRPKLIEHGERYGAFCSSFCERHPEAEPHLIGWFLDATMHEVTLRRILLALRVPSPFLARLGDFIPTFGLKQVWFGFVSRYTVWRGVRRGTSRRHWLQSTRGVPVLTYHAFGERDEEDRFVVSRHRFRRQLRLLRLLRYRFMKLETLASHLHRGEPLPSRTVALTIDDGYVDNLSLAFPLLQANQAPATFFIVSDRLGGRNDWSKDNRLAGRQILDRDEAQQLSSSVGISVGSHTRTHPSLPALPSTQVADEVEGSRRDLEDILSQEIVSFAYPYGRFDEREVDAVRDAGFDVACTTVPRPARFRDDPLLIPRIDIYGGDSLLRFLRKLWFGGG